MENEMIRTSETTLKAGPEFRAAQQEFAPVIKDATNPYFHSRYATLEAFYDSTRPALNKHGFAIMHGSKQQDGLLTVVTRLQHDSGEWFETGVTMALDKNTAQAVGSAISYGKRYGLGMLCGVAAEDDDDGNAANKPRKANPSDRPTEITDALEAKINACRTHEEMLGHALQEELKRPTGPLREKLRKVFQNRWNEIERAKPADTGATP